MAGSDQTHYQQNLYYAPNGSVAAAPGGMQVPNVIQVFRAAGNNAPKVATLIVDHAFRLCFCILVL